MREKVLGRSGVEGVGGRMQAEGTAGSRARRWQNMMSLENCGQSDVAGDVPREEEIRAEAAKKGKVELSRDLLS